MYFIDLVYIECYMGVLKDNEVGYRVSFMIVWLFFFRLNLKVFFREN